MAPTTKPATTMTMEEFQKEFRGRLYGAIAASLVAGLVAAVLGIWGYVKTLPGTVGLTPPGAVMAFELKAGCPTGWSPYRQAWGRFIIGAVETQDEIKTIPSGFSRDARDVELTPKPFGKPGGEEAHVLTQPELPKYKPKVIASNKKENTTKEAVLAQFKELLQPCQGTGCYDNGTITDLNHKPNDPRDDRLEVGQLGEDAAHNTMPPYVALYFCKKE